MEDALARLETWVKNDDTASLNPCCNGRCTRTIKKSSGRRNEKVLILVVMEDALAQLVDLSKAQLVSLNPCCNGRCTRTHFRSTLTNCQMSLNPCCNGRCTRTCFRRSDGL